MYRNLFIGIMLVGFVTVASAAPKSGTKFIEGLGLSKDCFHGLFGEYEKWRDKIISSNQKVDQFDVEKMFDATFPREKHTRFKNNLDCYLFAYKLDDLIIPAYYSAPKNINQDTKTPVIIYNRGGNGRFGSLNFADTIRILMPLAEQGFIVLATKLRGSSKGRKNGPSHVGWDEFGGEDVNDVLELLNVIDTLPSADKNQVFMVGHSRGGMMTYLAADRSDRFRAIVSIAGISDLTMIANNRPKFANMLAKRINYSAESKEQAFFQRSAIEWFGEKEHKPPLLMIHGELDEKVKIAHSRNLADRLTALDYPYSLYIYEDGDHDLMPYWDNVLTQVTSWFRQHAN